MALACSPRGRTNRKVFAVKPIGFHQARGLRRFMFTLRAVEGGRIKKLKPLDFRSRGLTDFHTANRSRSYRSTRRLVSSSIVCAGSSVFLGHGIGSCHCIGSLPHGFLTTKTDALQQPSRRSIAQGDKTWPNSRLSPTNSRAPALVC